MKSDKRSVHIVGIHVCNNQTVSEMNMFIDAGTLHARSLRWSFLGVLSEIIPDAYIALNLMEI
jgi:hypothetical protein